MQAILKTPWSTVTAEPRSSGLRPNTPKTAKTLNASKRSAGSSDLGGKKNPKLQVIQHKIGEMGRQCEALQAWIDYLTLGQTLSA